MRMMVKIIYDIKFPLYYNGKEENLSSILKLRRAVKKSKLGYQLENRIAYYMGRMIFRAEGY